MPFEEGIIILTLQRKKGRNKEIVNELINLIKRIIHGVGSGFDLLCPKAHLSVFISLN